MTGAISAILTLDWEFKSFNNADSGNIDISNDGGTTYTTLVTFQRNTGSSTPVLGSVNVDISAYISDNTRVRIRPVNLGGTAEYLYVDNVEISYVSPPPVTSGEIKGHVYKDSNADGIEDRNELDVPDVNITVYPKLCNRKSFEFNKPSKTF